MKKFLHNFRSLIYCVGEIIIGILILINHVAFTNTIVRALGAVLIVLGVLNIMKYFKQTAEDGAMSMGLSKGLIQILAGIFCIFNPEWFTTTFTFLSVAYGVGILVVGMIKLQWAVDALRLGNTSWAFSLLGGASSIILGLLIVSTLLAENVAWIFVGVTLIVIGAFDGAAAFLGKTIVDKAVDDEESIEASESKVEIIDCK